MTDPIEHAAALPGPAVDLTGAMTAQTPPLQRRDDELVMGDEGNDEVGEQYASAIFVGGLHDGLPRDAAGCVLGAWRVQEEDLERAAELDERLAADSLHGALVDRAVSLGLRVESAEAL